MGISPMEGFPQLYIRFTVIAVRRQVGRVALRPLSPGYTLVHVNWDILQMTNILSFVDAALNSICL